MTSPCSSCTKRCCSSYTVSVTGYDAWVIGAGLHLPLDSFLVHFPVAEDNDRGFLLEPNGQRFEIALDKAGKFQKGNPCVFWIDLGNDRGRCGIYPFRPYVCQTYPAYLQQDTIMLRDDVLCPAGSWNLTGMDLPLFRQRLYRFRTEQDIYAYIVAGWNRSVERMAARRSVQEYYLHLTNIYESLERFRNSVPGAVLTRVVERWGEFDHSRPNPLFVDLDAGDDGWREVIAGIQSGVDRFTAAPAAEGVSI